MTPSTQPPDPVIAEYARLYGDLFQSLWQVSAATSGALGAIHDAGLTIQAQALSLMLGEVGRTSQALRAFAAAHPEIDAAGSKEVVQ
jgi:hypothetical protein